MIKNQYETAVTAEEVNKLLQENLEKYLNEEKINILGNPLPVAMEDNIDWKSSELSFAFELGLAPKFDLNLSEKNKIIQYHITASESMINDQINQQKSSSADWLQGNTHLKTLRLPLFLKMTRLKIEATNTFDLSLINGKSNISALKKATVGTLLNLKFKKLFKDEATASRILNISPDKILEIKGEITIDIKEINERVMAEINQEFFDKIYGPNQVNSEEEMRQKVVEQMEKQFENQSDQKLLNDITEYLVNKTKFDLPDKFLIKWMQNSGEKSLNAEDARKRI